MTERKTFLRGILGTGGLGGCLRRRLGSAVPEYYTALPQLKDLAADNNLSVLDSVIGRICDALVQGVNDKSRLPKVILIIIDEDLDVVQDDHHQTYVMGTLIYWMISEFNKIVEMQKDVLPRKAVKPEYLTFIWIAPPLNVNFVNNDYRQTITTCIKDATEVHSCHIMMKMVKVWDSKDQLLYRNGRFTEIGFSRYWAAIDSAVQFWDKHLVPKGGQMQKPAYLLISS